MLVSVKTYIQPVGRPSDEFTTEMEYDLGDGVGLDSGTVDDIASALVEGYVGLLLDAYKVDRMVFSQWESDTEDYDPSLVRVIPWNRPGEILVGSGEIVDESVVLFIRRQVPLGRPGKILFRGALLTSALESTDGQWSLESTAEAAIATRVAALYTQASSILAPVMIGKSQVGDVIYPATAEGVKQISIRNYAETPTVRSITNFVLAGVRERQVTQ